MTTDTIAAARALIEPLTGYTPGRWQCSRADLASYDADTGAQVSYLYPGDGERVRFETDNPVEDARLAAAAPDLRDTVATLADSLEAERAKVAAARLEGWRAGRDAAAARCWEERGLLDGAEILTNLIRALPEPKEDSHD